MKWYLAGQSIAIFAMTVVLVLCYLYPGPVAVDAPWPVYWALVRDIKMGLVLFGSTAMGISSAYYYVQDESVFSWKKRTMVFAPLVVGLSVSALILGSYSL